ncbi:hypothetical protein LOTGIDRAFT_174147 [Lottia gigantea]|uniref:Uncharacterized protein n=1 Tax=Lottia gigantea TaxID=225164 RepID=V4AUJ3_LOTGI|nr:hypothetical protein LOTGIDRAFT_174147 [Lottia gigantea]ESO98610.1 hypothetical protein LOTGIDRAFT_174147 [Lottia gigantea]
MPCVISDYIEELFFIMCIFQLVLLIIMVLRIDRDPVLPLDNILKPRRKFMGEGDFHQVALENQYRSFFQVHKYMKKAKQRQAKYANKNTKNIDFKTGDPVYYKNFLRKNKLEDRWSPYHRIVEQTSPVSFKIRNQLTNRVIKAHAEHLRLANIDEWDIPKDTNKLRKAQYVEPPSESSSEGSDSEYSEDDELPLSELIKKYRRVRENSSSEDDIPLMEMAQRIRVENDSANDASSNDMVVA